jgi:hypothetical protein
MGDRMLRLAGRRAGGVTAVGPADSIAGQLSIRSKSSAVTENLNQPNIRIVALRLWDVRAYRGGLRLKARRMSDEVFAQLVDFVYFQLCTMFSAA